MGLVQRSTEPVEILTRVQFCQVFCTCVKISIGPVLLCTKPKSLPFKRKGLGPVHRSTGPVEILTRVQFCPVFVHVSKSQRIQCTGALDLLRSLHVSSFVQFLYTCQNLNWSSASVHWTQAAPLQRERIGSSAPEHWTR
jgi:hypothetical protein